MRRKLAALAELTSRLVSSVDIDEILDSLGKGLGDLIEHRGLWLDLPALDREGLETRALFVADDGSPLSMRPVQVTPYPDGLQAALTEGTSSVTLIDPSDPLWARRVRRRAIVPILGQDGPLGALTVALGPQEPEDEDLPLLESIAVHISVALRNAQNNAETERVYQELEETQTGLVRTEKLEALGEMAAGVAHDFNNLLAAILGRAQMLKMTLENEEVLQSIGVIEQAALDGARTVARIQDFARAETRRDRERVDVRTLVEDTVERARPALHARTEHVVQLDASECASAQVVGNASELRQVLTNLINNAIDAMPDGGRIRVRSGHADDQAWISVTDEGVGMNTETRERMFNPFFTTKGSRGTGLGLSVSYGIIKRHGGQLEVESTQGEGTTVRVLLPRSDAAPRPSEASQQRSRAGSRPVRILVIDDDEDVREVLTDILRTAEHDVVAAKNGAEGLELFSKSEFDLVFTDLRMPEMTGLEVAEGIKATSPKTPVGLITGWGSTLEEARVMDSGVDMIVAKPFRYDQVLTLVDEAMAERRRGVDG